MIQVGQPSRIGVTFRAAGLHVAARVFNTAGPVTGWFAMTNFDGHSYGADYTFSAPGSYAIKKVVFTDGTFVTRDTTYSEADDAVQVVDAAATVLDGPIASHETPGTVGGAIASGGSAGGGAAVIAIINNQPVLGIIAASPVVAVVEE